MATKEQQDQHAADYADQFNKEDTPPRDVSDEEAFGLTPEQEGSPAEEASESPATEAAEEPAGEGTPIEQAAEAAQPAESPAAEAAEAPGEAAPSAADQEQRLKSWEGRLKAKQAELDAREASMGTTNANEEQASLPMGEDAGHEAGEDSYVEQAEESEPGKALAEDFGEDFVEQITKLMKQITYECMGGVSTKVDQVIADLQNERMQNHFNSIASAHADFMDVVESPEFAAWKASQPDQAALQQVIDAGSARQIIAMLTAFKQSRASTDGGTNDDAIDAAEGVRSSGVTLPKEPTASDDFAKAWNEA